MRRASKRFSKTITYKENHSSDSSDDEEPIIKSKKKDIHNRKVLDDGLKKQEVQKVLKNEDNDNGSSSDSSIGGNFKTTDKIDSISFFENITDVSTSKSDLKGESKSLSDSEDSNLEDVHVTEGNTIKNDVFQQIEDYQKKLENAKQKLMNFSKNLTPNEQLLDIKALLKMGETPGDESQTFDTDEESEFEEVEHTEIVKPSTHVPEEGLQITVEIANLQSSSKSKKEVDMMAMIKRKINRVKKEYQVYIHRVHLLCWIGHGNYVNSILNNVNLLALALSLIPSENCYPDGRLTLSYLEQITRWYSKVFKLKSEPVNRTIEDILKELSLDKALILDMSRKEASTRKNFVLIFICMLRALGIQCRLVLSFRAAPLRPPHSELCSLSTKKVELPKKQKHKEITKLNIALKDLNKKQEMRSTNLLGCPKKSIFFEDKSKKNKTAISKLKIPQIDGANDNLPNVPKVRKAIKNIPTEKQNKKTSVKINVNDQSISSSDEYFQSEKPVTKIPRSKSIGRRKVRKSLEDTILNEEKIVRKSRSKSASEAKVSIKQYRSKSPLITPKKSGKYLMNKDKLLKEIKTEGKSPTTSKKLTQNTITNEEKLIKTHGIKPCSKTTSNTLKKSQVNAVKPRSMSVPKKQTNARKPLTNEEKLLKAQGIKLRSKSDSNLKKSPFFDNKVTSNTKSSKKNSALDPKLKNTVVKGLSKPRASKARKSVEAYNDTTEYLSDESIPKKKRKSSSDDEFDIKTKNKIKTKVDQLKKSIDRRVLSTDDDDEDKKKNKLGNDVWAEVFVEEEEKWISVDVIKGQVHCVQQLSSRATQPVIYTVVWNNNGTLKDVTSRYSKNWNTVTRKLRDDPAWWKETLKPYEEKKTAREKEEDEELAKQQLDQPLPTTISEYKNHPLYALKRHLLKFEAIYPPDASTLGFVRNEPVYARECVHTLHSREIWVKQARVVKPFEKPYKIVKARPKYDRLTGTVTTDIPLEIFGIWQTQDYEPPVAENGKVPRNAYGNVELFKKCMLPIGTVHLQLPSLSKVAKKLGIDCAPAVVGFDYHSGSSHPTFDGFVVCEEFEDTLLAAWEQDQIETEKRAREKIEKRVYDNWRRIIKGLFIRERLQQRYNFGGDKKTDSTKQKGSLKVATRNQKIHNNDSDKSNK